MELKFNEETRNKYKEYFEILKAENKKASEGATIPKKVEKKETSAKAKDEKNGDNSAVAKKSWAKWIYGSMTAVGLFALGALLYRKYK